MFDRSRRFLVICAAIVSSIAGCSDRPAGLSEVPPESSTSTSSLSKSAVAQDRIPDHYIVVLRSDVRNAESVANELSRAHGLTRGFVYQNTIKGFSAVVPAGRLNALQRDPRVLYIEPDRVVTIDPSAAKRPGGGGGSTSQSTPWGITRVGGGQTYTGTAVAWIIDSGVDLDHPDLKVDLARSRDFTGSRVGADDENGHGTHVAGTVAAVNNNFGVVGVAAGATVVAVRVLDRRGSGSYSGVIAGVDYVGSVAQPGDVANMSLGGPESQALEAAVVSASARVAFSLAAGNESVNADTKSPAGANGTNIYTISAFGSGDVWASFSNFGPSVDYAAPGVSVYSCYKDGGYTTFNGTSMAAPHVAGLLLWGALAQDGTVLGDPDGQADPIARRSSSTTAAQ